jgi:hypothetical protein
MIEGIVPGNRPDHNSPDEAGIETNSPLSL